MPVFRLRRTRNHSLAALVLVLLSGCTLAPQQSEPERPVPVEVELDPPAQRPPPEPPKTVVKPPSPACEWSHTKGVAEVVALDDDEAEFRFYPGNIPVPVAESQRLESGTEFKAVLLQADGCAPKLKVVDSVP